MTNLPLALCRRRIVLAISLAVAAVDASAITISVNDNGDSAIPAGCTLRDAITAVDNAAFAASDPCTTAGAFGSNDTIVFAAALAGSTITLQQGQLAISKPLTITGSGQTIDANAASRAFSVSADVSVANLTVTNASVSGTGSAFYLGGAGHTLTLANMVISGNANTSSGAGAVFAGISTGLNLIDTRVTSNTSSYKVAGIYAQSSAVVVTRSTISGNSVTCTGAYCASGIYATGSTLQVNGSTISGNVASSSGNYAVGGVYSWDSVTSIINSTITGNSASGIHSVAGGIWEGHGSGASYLVDGLTLTNTTVVGNNAIATNPGAPYVAGGALVAADYNLGTLVLGNSIIAGNGASGGAAPANDFATNATNNPTLSFSYSLLGSALNVNPYNSAGNHNVFTDTPGLGLLQNNGGHTLTMALLPGSPAIDTGSNALAVDASAQPLQTDQTGYIRIHNSTVDIGAFEYPGDHIFGDGFE